MKLLVARLCLAGLAIATFSSAAETVVQAGDWLTLPSTYTHSPTNGERIKQYAQVEAPPLTNQSALVAGGYTNFRSSIQYGQSADNYHRVNQWGATVRPYGEWNFPYRPYSSPYPAWGAPFAGVNTGFGYGGGGFGGGGFGGGGNQGGGFPGGGFPGAGYPGGGNQAGGYPGGVTPGGGIPGQPYQPYPAAPNSPYPVPPWYDGYQPDYPVTPQLNDRDFFRNPSTIGLGP